MKVFKIELKYTLEESFELEFDSRKDAEDYALECVPEGAFLEDLTVTEIGDDE